MTSTESYRLKASILRGYVTVLREAREFDAVAAAVSPATRALMNDPPVASVWLDPEPIDEIMDAIEARSGVAGVKRIARAGLNVGVVPLLRPVLSGLLRLFGATPPTLYRRIDTLIAATLRGVAFAYEETGPRSGYVDASIYGAGVRMTRFYRFLAAYELIGEVCGHKVRVSDPRLIDSGAWGSRARCDVTW